MAASGSRCTRRDAGRDSKNKMNANLQSPQLTAAPVIETERLRLLGHGIHDFPDCVAMWSEPEVVRYTLGEPSPPQRTWLRILAYRGHWALQGFGYWAVQEQHSGRYIGELGFADFKRNMKVSLGGIPELGWALAPWAQGKGYATEALKAAVAWGDRQFQSPRTVCIIHRENERSLRVAAKLGYCTVLQASGESEPNVILARDAPARFAL
jgi:RimJ/RimL family protein N-acetyltransferase